MLLMRIVGDIPHPHYKITIFSYNSKYIVKFELSDFEQIFKVNEADVGSLDELKAMFDENFMVSTLHRFKSMSQDFNAAWKSLKK